MKNPEVTNIQLRNSWEKFNKMDTLDLLISSANWAWRYSEEENCNENARLFISQLLKNEEGRILDVGSSLFAQTYLPFGKRITFFDWTTFGLPNTGERALGEAPHLPFLDKSFNVVLSKQLYGYLLQPDNLLTEMTRVLSSKGLFILIDYEGDIVRLEEGQPVPRLFNFQSEKVFEQLVDLGIKTPQIKHLNSWSDFEVRPGFRINFSLTAITGRLKPKRST
jgi:SAM-dependent methyltransferase